MFHRTLLTLTILTLLCCCLPLRADESQDRKNVLDDAWQVVFIQNDRVGFSHSLTWETGNGADKRIWSESMMQMSLSRFGQTLTMTVTQLTEEDEAGNLKSFRIDTNNPPASHTVVSGRVEGDTLTLTTTAAGKSTTAEQPWDPDVKSPVYQDRLLQEDPLDVGETREIRVFDPQFLKPGTVKLTGMEPAEAKLLDGTEPRLERTQIVHSLLPLMSMTSYQNEGGETLKTETQLMGMVTYTVSREEAVKEIPGKQLDLALDTMVRVEPLSDPHRQSLLVYELSVEKPQEILEFPAGDAQSVTRVDDQTVHLTIRAADPSAEPTPGDHATVDESFRDPSRYLESAHPQVVALADAAAADLENPTEIALAMERYVHEKLASKNFSTALATAAEVATSLEGDCTEHAMLLAAMLRSKDIPSRVAVGLVYSRRHEAFVGHMWTEAFLNGRWVPLDATLGQGGTGAGHLKFSDSSLADSGPAPATAFLPLVGLLGKLEIKVVDAGDN